MKILELFAGTRSIGTAFEAHGHDVYSIEWDEKFKNIDMYADIETVTSDDIIKNFGYPDVIWASPDCTTFSVAAISHHRRKNSVTGNLDPISEYAKKCDRVDQHVLELIRDLEPRYWFIENPRGAMRKMTWMQGLPRYTVTYCQVWRHSDETDRHMDESSVSEIQASMQKWRSMPCFRSKRSKDRNTGNHRKYDAVGHPSRTM